MAELNSCITVSLMRTFRLRMLRTNAIRLIDFESDAKRSLLVLR